MHRDLKPENILVSETGEVKIIDFGLARRFTKSGRFTDVVGTPYYVAPESLLKNHGKESDMWSLGVLMYLMMCGYLPFSGNTPEEVFKKIIDGKFIDTQPEWEHHSLEAKDLLKQLLTVNYWERITPVEALEHPWFVNFESSSSQTKTSDAP